jgi:Mor family transcriptional regulator
MTNDIDLFGLPDDDETRRQLIEHGGEDLPETKWAPQLAELVRLLEARNARRGMSAKDAFNQAAEDVLAIAQQMGGLMFYLPRGDALKTSLRHAEIYRKFKGNNHDALAKEFKLTVVQIYRVLRQQQRLNMGRIQPGLF